MTTAAPDRPAPSAEALAELAAACTGPVSAGGTDDAAVEAATFNLAVVHHPAVVVGAAGPADVVAAVRWAVRHGLGVGVHNTGHGPVVPVDGAVLISTRRIGGVTVDPERRTARVGAGVRWRDVLDATAVHGLAPLCGSSSQVGVVGFTLGGGVGLLGREHGFAALEFELLEVRELHAGSLFYDIGHAPALLHAFREWTPTLPERTTASIALLRLPPLPALPEPLRGRAVVHLRFSHHGPAEEGEELLAPMTALAEPLLGGVGPLPYAALDAVHQDPTEPVPAWLHAVLLRELTAEGVEALVRAHAPGAESPMLVVEVRHLGGALGREAAVPNAVAGRDGRYSVWLLGLETTETVAHLDGVGARLSADLAPWDTGTALLNFLARVSGPEQIAQAWTPEQRTRLRALKARLDPQRVFRFGHALV